VKIGLERGSSPYELPRPAIAAGALLIALGIVVAALAARPGPVTCPFRLVTGFPCPTCGMVRATRHVMHGEFAAAWQTNPLDAFSLLVAAPATVVMLLANRLGRWAMRIQVGGKERAILWALAVAAFVANWVYVLRSGI
jgi:hypothetical protein